jgi:hypothetical protein
MKTLTIRQIYEVYSVAALDKMLLFLLFTVAFAFGGNLVRAAELDVLKVGLVEVDDWPFVETSATKAMFPVAAHDHLMFVLVDDTSGRAADKVFTYKISDILSPRSWVPKPVRIIRALEQDSDDWNEGGSSAISAIFNGGIVLRRNSSLSSDLVDGISGEAALSGPLKQGVRALLHRDGTGDFLVSSEGLFYGNSLIFRCGEVLNVSVAGDRIVVGYLDEQNVPRFGVITVDGSGECKGREHDPLGFEPKLSPSGRYVGAVVPRHDGSRIFDLAVFEIGNGGVSEIGRSDGVELYDIEVYDFKYEGSISWRQDGTTESIYYKPTKPGSDRAIGRIDCRDGTCSSAGLLHAPRCVNIVDAEDSPGFDSEADKPAPSWKHDTPPDPFGDQFPIIVWVEAKGRCGSEMARDEPRVEIASISWSVPLFDGSRRLLAAQAVIRSSKAGGRPVWTSRVILLGEKAP